MAKTITAPISAARVRREASGIPHISQSSMSEAEKYLWGFSEKSRLGQKSRLKGAEHLGSDASGFRLSSGAPFVRPKATERSDSDPLDATIQHSETRVRLFREMAVDSLWRRIASGQGEEVLREIINLEEDLRSCLAELEAIGEAAAERAASQAQPKLSRREKK